MACIVCCVWCIVLSEKVCYLAKIIYSVTNTTNIMIHGITQLMADTFNEKLNW